MPGNRNDPPRPRDERDRDDDDDRPRRRRRDDDDDDFDDRPRRRRESGDDGPSNGLATAGLILGILSLCTGPLAGGPALICAGLALGKPRGRGAATAGLVLGAIGTLVLPIVGYLLLIPAVSKVRDAAARMNDQNNLKMISIGATNHENATGKFPPAAGELSWRVHILPYIEQENVYRQFDVKQPWDAPANKRLAGTQVKTYVSAADPPGTTETRYRVFVGPGTLYEPGKPPPVLAQIQDGSSNTIFAVEAGDTVPWPQPKELQYDRNGPLPALGVPRRKGFNVAMADGSVKFVSDKVSPEVIRGGIEPNDGKFFNP
jgi:prepilin-type processing-associated H-X9-DG protein